VKSTRLVAIALALCAFACMGGQGYNPTQADADSPNQEYMLFEMQRLEPMLNIGHFVAYFKEPPDKTYAGWASCNPGSGHPPWVINFNNGYVETLEDKSYMTSLVAHEMCHHWLNVQHGQCYGVESEVEACAWNLITYGKPK
jgi:hypothetical protein